MNSYEAHEYLTATMRSTGRVEIYQTASLTEAVAGCLYTHRLRNGNTYMGPTGRCVYDGRLSYAIMPVGATA